MRILLVEDDIPLARQLKTSLQTQGHAVDHVEFGKHALSSAVNQDCNLVVLDLGLPDMDGLEVLKQLKHSHKDLPVLILTARDGIESKVTGLDLGADDYLSKPFASDELFARIRVIERKQGTSDSALITIGDVSLDTRANTLSVNQTSVNLSRRELMICKALMDNEGRIQSKDSLESKLYAWGDEISSNTIEVHVSNLRKKLPKDFIKTIRGVGYVVRKP